MRLKNLVGFQLISLDNEQMVVQKDSKVYSLNFMCDEGDCCGYSNIFNTLFIDTNDIKENPIITNIEYSSTNDDYDTIKITLFGGMKKLAQIEAEAGSGSGWCYGATVTVECQPLEMSETLVSW
jgi:hypothetical protein